MEKELIQVFIDNNVKNNTIIRNLCRDINDISLVNNRLVKTVRSEAKCIRALSLCVVGLSLVCLSFNNDISALKNKINRLENQETEKEE